MPQVGLEGHYSWPVPSFFYHAVTVVGAIRPCSNVIIIIITRVVQLEVRFLVQVPLT
jgi:hypothetical protein